MLKCPNFCDGVFTTSAKVVQTFVESLGPTLYSLDGDTRLNSGRTKGEKEQKFAPIGTKKSAKKSARPKTRSTTAVDTKVISYV